MGHFKAMAIKAVMTLIVFWIILGAIYGMSFWPMILLTTVILGVISYFVGDLITLPAVGNMMATLSDLVFVFFGVWLLGMWLTDTTGGTAAMAAIVSAIVIGIGEYFFHIYMIKSGPISRKDADNSEY